MTELESVLPSLPVYQSHQGRAVRIRARCHDALGERSSRRGLESALVIGACVAYLSGVIRTALLLYSF